MTAGSLKIRSKVGRIESRSSRVSLTSKTMIGCSDIADLSFAGGEGAGRQSRRGGCLLGPAWPPRLTRAPSDLLMRRSQMAIGRAMLPRSTAGRSDDRCHSAVDVDHLT